jgi:uncharacterized protein YjbI with pentapeptide repeats
MANSTEGFRNRQSKSWRGQDCRGMDFSGRDLGNVDFTDAILDGVDFSGADLRGAIFRRSSLIGANLANIRAGVAENKATSIAYFFSFLTVLTGLMIGLIGSSLTGLLTDRSPIFSSYREIAFWIPWSTVAGLIAIGCSAIYGYTLLWKNPVIAILSSVLYLIAIEIILPWMFVYACLPSARSCESLETKMAVNSSARSAWALVGDMKMIVEGSAMTAVLQIMLANVCLSVFRSILKSDRKTIISLFIGIAASLISMFTAQAPLDIIPGTIIISAAIIYLGWEIGNRINLQHPDYRYLDRAITYISTYYGTCFDRANLTDATLEAANLKNANLSRANLTRTNFYNSQHLQSAKRDRTILVDPLVCELSVTHQGRNRTYANCNLQGAYLVESDLQNADLTRANLNDADLSHARLDNANLTRILALNTNLTRVNLTGACIADWSIDRTTDLTDIHCDYIYLKSPTEERTPASGSFNPGGFTRLFQEVWNTVDLIFDRGIDWLTFSRAWQQIQIEYAGDILEVNSIERKGEGTIVVKVEVPRILDKGRFHQDFDRYYQLGLATATDRYRSELEGKDREITIYREQQANLQSLLQSLVKPAVITGNTERVVFLKLADRDLHGEIDVRVEIADRGATPRAATIGKLTNLDEVLRAYTTWQTSYDSYIEGTHSRIDIARDRPTNLSDRSVIRDCQIAAQNLKQQLNTCLDRSEFKPIKELMLQELHPSQSIQIIIQTDDLQIRQLPWQLWNLLEIFRQAEITFASHTYQARERDRSPRQPLQVLAIFGNSEGIDLTVDRQLLTTLPNANVELLISPSRQILNDKIWSKAWDIIFFAGHSSSDRNLEHGYIELNPQERASIAELKYAFQKAIDRGLKLVMLNSCDGWGLATELIDLQLAQAIFMREPIPDLVAQQFLRHFLTAFTNGLPLYLAVREAREKLQGLEDRYPCATWLPVICQNPSNISAEL